MCLQIVATMVSSLSRARDRSTLEAAQRGGVRKEQVAIAGNTTPESIQAQIQAAIAADAKRWQASDKCNPDAISQPMTRVFCEGIHQLEAKKAAAIKRDEIDRQLAELDAKDIEAPPAAVDSYVANMGRFLGLLGYTVDNKAKELLAASRDWLKGVGVELLAAFGPGRPAFPAFTPDWPSAPRSPSAATAAEEAREGGKGDGRADRRGNPGKRLCDRRNRRNVAIVA
jgi:hypothetical protein